MVHPYQGENRAIHLLLPVELVASLDKYRTRYTTRTSLIAHAIELYVADLASMSNEMNNQSQNKE